MTQKQYRMPYWTTKKTYCPIKCIKSGQTKFYEASDLNGGFIRLKVKGKINKAASKLKDLFFSKYLIKS